MSDETRKIQLSTEVDSRGARDGLQDVVRAAEFKSFPLCILGFLRSGM